MDEKKVPFSFESEKNLLASIIVEPEILFELISKLSYDDFLDKRHQNIYKAIVRLNNEGNNIELVTIIEEYKKISKVWSGDDVKYIAEIANELSSGFKYNNYYEYVKNAADKRRLIDITKDLSTLGYDSTVDFSKYIDIAEQKINELNRNRDVSKLFSLNEVWSEVQTKVDEIKRFRASIGDDANATTGLTTGFTKLNTQTSGWQKEELVILAARPGVGKSAFAMQLAINAAEHDKTVVFFSLEMSTLQLGQRFIANLTGIPMNQIREASLDADQQFFISKTKNDYQKYKIFFDDHCNGTIDDIRSKTKKIEQEYGLDLIIIDYLQLLNEPGVANRQEEISKISRRLKQMAREFKVPIIALSQLSREVEKRENKIPVLSDLRESGSIEQDADMVLFLYSADKYKKIGEQKDNKIQLIISKNRQGSSPYTITYDFYGHLSSFEESNQTEETN